LEPKETAEALAALLKDGLSTRELADKLGKDHSYVLNMSRAGELLITLEKHGMKAEYYAKDKDRESGKAIPVQHAIWVADVARQAPEQFDELKHIQPFIQ
jgi:uncharacterized protein with PIN domain